MKRHLKMESDTNSTAYSAPSTSLRLGKCEVCNHEEAKYTCPKCEIKTCCIRCLNVHKKELDCNGIRDRTKYKPMKKMTKMDFMNDYYFLEECTRYVEDRRTDKIKRFTRYKKNLPTHLFKFRNAALERKTTLRFLLPNFTRHSSNTAYYDWKLKLIRWRVEWIFVNAGSLKFVDERCSETDTLAELLDKYLNVENCEAVPMKKQLEAYQSRGIGNLKVLLKAEGIKQCCNRFYELDCDKTLMENLSGKTVVEFPIIYVCYDTLADDFDIVDSDDDVENEAKKFQKELDDQYQRARMPTIKTEEEIKKEEIAKKREERKKRRTKREKEPMNFLFTDENEPDLSSDSDDGNETEEELPEKAGLI